MEKIYYLTMVGHDQQNIVDFLSDVGLLDGDPIEVDELIREIYETSKQVASKEYLFAFRPGDPRWWCVQTEKPMTLGDLLSKYSHML